MLQNYFTNQKIRSPFNPFQEMNLKRRAIELKEELSLMEPESSYADIQEKAIGMCIALLQEFDFVISQKPFHDQEDEIEYFKEIRQIPQHYLIYYYKLRKFHLQAPQFPVKAQKKYIEDELRTLNEFYRQHRDFVQYTDRDETFLDIFFFTRDQSSQFILQQSLDYMISPSVHTSHDVLLSKILAYRKYGRFLSRRLALLDSPFGNQNANKPSSVSLHWTGSKAGLTELVYSLYHSGALNRGQADIKDIAMALERTFNFELGDIYRNFMEIRYRKKSRTKFLDELSEKLIHALDQELE